MTVVQVVGEWGGGRHSAGVMSFDAKGQDGKVCTEGQVVPCAVCALSCCSSSERQTLEHPSESLLCGVRKLLEGLSTNSCFSSMKNRSKGINCLSSLCSLPWLWATFPFLGPGNNSGREMGSFKPGRRLASSDQPLGSFWGTWARHWQHVSKESLNNHETLPEKRLLTYVVYCGLKSVLKPNKQKSKQKQLLQIFTIGSKCETIIIASVNNNFE